MMTTTNSPVRNVCSLRATALLWLVATIVPLVPSTVPCLAGGKGNPNPGVIPANERYEELSAEWWQWVLSIDPTVNPLLVTDGTEVACGASQSGSVVFLAGTFGDPAIRNCTVKTGTSLFFPLVNAVVLLSTTDPQESEAALLADAEGFLDDYGLDRLFASINGANLNDLFRYRSHSSAFSIAGSKLLRDGFGFPDGDSPLAVTDGYWLLLTPLPPGTYEIHIGGSSGGSYVQNVIYHVTVVPGRK